MSETEGGDQVNPAVEDGPRYFAELIDQIIAELEGYFATHLEDMFRQMDENLFESANNASSIAEQNSLFECMNEVRKEKQGIQQGFVDELSEYLQPVAELEKLPEKKPKKKPAALSLVEENEMDELVTLSTMSSKAAMDNAEAIGNLVKRFKELSEYNDHIFHGEALDPKHLCEAMHDAVAKTELVDANKLVVFQYFDRAVLRDLSRLYDVLNNLLVSQGILPEIDYSADMPHYDYPEEVEEAEQPQAPPPQQRPPLPPGARRAFGSGMQGYSGYNPQAAAPPPMPGAGAPMPAPMAPPPMPGGAGFAPPPGGGRRAFGSGMQGFAQPQPAYDPSLPNAGQPNMGQPNAGPTAGAPAATSPYGPSGQSYSAGVPVGQVRQSIQDFVGGTQADVSGVDAGVYYTQQQVITALTQMQAPAGNLSQTPLVFDANQIKKALLANIGETEGGAVTKSVHQVSEKTIDFIKLIFDGIIEEDSITDEIKTLLLSLQIPVIKAAMIDSDFFVDDQHPARLLLDKIAEAGVGVTEHTDPIYIEIDKIVHKLLGDYNEDVKAFSVALNELHELTEEIYRKARETEAESQKTVKMAHAKKTVLQEIRKITLGKELPEGVRTLVLKVWPSMMFNHFLKKGKANDEWVELLMILQKIIESVQPLQNVAAQEELGLTHQDIINAASRKLNTSKKGQEMVENLMQDLKVTYDELITQEGLPDEAEPEVDESLLGQAQAAGQVAEAEIEPHGEVQLEEQGELPATGEAEADAQAGETATTEAADAQPEAEPGEQSPPPAPAIPDAEEVARLKISKLPEGVAPGAWCIVYNGEDKPVRRLKLAVILVQDATMVFVDHLGNVVIEKDAEVFADEVEKGLSGIIMQHSVFDHALHSALQTIER